MSLVSFRRGRIFQIQHCTRVSDETPYKHGSNYKYIIKVPDSQFAKMKYGHH